MAKKVNEFYFNKIDSHNKAYVLGYLAADGYFDTECNRIHLDLHEKDVAALEFIKKEMQSDATIMKPLSDSVKISIQRKQIGEDLRKLGFTNHKSKDCVFPDIPEQFANSFILGVFDGDGCVHLERYGKHKHLSRLAIGILGTLPLVTEIKNRLDNIGIKSAIGNTDNNFTFQLRFSSKDSVYKFYKYMYNGSDFSLVRKHNKFNDFFNNKIK